MTGVILTIAVIAIALLLQAITLRMTATWAGSKRATWICTAIALIVIILINAGLGLAELKLVQIQEPPVSTPPARIGLPVAEPQGRSILVAESIGLCAVQLVMVFFALRVVYSLSMARAAVPFVSFLFCTGLVVFGFFKGVRPYVLEGFVVPTSSNAPTLQPDDHIQVDKLQTPRRGQMVV